MSTILIVEDEPAFRRVLAAYLQTKGFTVVAAADGADALRLLKDHEVDLAVLDLLMPKVNGKAVAAAIFASDDFVFGAVPGIWLLLVNLQNNSTSFRFAPFAFGAFLNVRTSCHAERSSFWPFRSCSTVRICSLGCCVPAGLV